MRYNHNRWKPYALDFHRVVILWLHANYIGLRSRGSCYRAFFALEMCIRTPIG